MHALNLPEPIAAYFRADAGSGLAVAHCFTPDGWVRDEGHTHTGTPPLPPGKTMQRRATPAPFNRTALSGTPTAMR